MTRLFTSLRFKLLLIIILNPFVHFLKYVITTIYIYSTQCKPYCKFVIQNLQDLIFKQFESILIIIISNI